MQRHATSLGRRTRPARRTAAPCTVARRAAAARPALEALVGSIEAAQGRPRASSSALRGRGSAGHRRRSSHGARPRGPRTGRPRLARQQLSGTSWRREQFCAWSCGTRAHRWLGALVQLTGGATAARAGSRCACVVTLGGARWRASFEATAHPSVPRMDLPGGRPYPGGRGGPRSASAGAKAAIFLNHPARITHQMSHSERPILKTAPRQGEENPVY